MRDSEIILCKGIKMDINYENVLSYSESDMLSLCRNKSIYSSNGTSILGSKGNTIDLSVTYGVAMYANYMAFRNPTYGNKWMFAFVTDVKYLSDSACRITYKLDVWSTWYSRFNIGKAFVEREHVDDDTVGKHTIPENLETGDYTVQGTEVIDVYGDDLDDYYIVLGVTKYPGTTAVPGENTGGKIYGGLFSGLAYITGEDIAGITNIMRSYEDVGGPDSIQCIFPCPKYLCTSVSWVTVVGWSYNVKYGVINETVDEWGASTMPITKPTTLADNYTPVNKKLLTWPYRFLNIDNNAGNCIDLRYEDFSTNNITFDVMGTITPSLSFKISPDNYKGVNPNYLYSFTPCKLPVCNWQSDIYTNWMTQNAVNVGLNVAGSGVGLVTGLLTGNPIGVASGILGIANSIGQVYEHSLIPPSLKGNINSGDVNFAAKLVNPIVYEMSIKKEYAVAIDGYFSRFGYKVNETKQPNLKTRTKFNYIKIGGTDDLIDGDIPAVALSEINDIFRKGVTIFHSYSDFGNYTISNPIRSS